MKKFFEKLLIKLQSPVVITAFVLFLLQILVENKVINLGESQISDIAEFIGSLISKAFIGFSILNNPNDRKHF